MSITGSRQWSSILILAAAAASCESAQVSASAAGGSSGNSGASAPAAPTGGVAGGSGGGSILLPDASPGVNAGMDAPASNQTCAEEAHKAEIVPLDLMILVDASASMSDPAGMGSKWDAAQSALSAFVRDPRSAGLGVGLQFYPGGKERPCMSDTDCGWMRPGTFYCKPRQVCVGAGGLNGAPSCGGPNSGACPAGTTCTNIGRCSTSRADCLNVGQDCPAGGGMCVGGERSCRDTLPATGCDDAGYATPAVGIGGLPANESDLVRAVMSKDPVGSTPMGPAVRGVLTQLRAHIMANPGRKVALVLVGDGLPGGCAMNDIGSIATNLTAARAATPSIPTYVIGVFSPEDAAVSQVQMDRLAMAGGTTRSILLTSTPDLTQRLQQSLDQIRGAAIACEFAIPPPKMGAIDLKRVNVRYTGAAGPVDLPYVETADKCDATRGGWYYDVPPSSGTPSRIRVCDASCRGFNMDAKAQVSLLFGCATRVIE